MDNALDELLQQPHIWRAGEGGAQSDCVASGFSELDRALPGGGWPVGALTELLHDTPGIGELRLVLPALARLSHAGRWIAMVAPPRIPYAPALAAQGVDLSRLLLIHPRSGSDTLWALEQSMRSGSCAAVLAWPRQAEPAQLRRLQLAAEAGRCWGILFRSGAAATERSPAALRIALHGTDDTRTRLALLKARGGAPRQELLLDLERPRTRSLPVPEQPLLHRAGPATERPRPERRPRQDQPAPPRPPQLDLPLEPPRHR